MEAVIAAALLAGIAVTAPGSATSPVPRPLAQWGRAEIPVLDALIADTDATVSSHGARLGPLEAEVAAAAHMPPPPDPNVATVWYRALGELAGGVEALAGGTPGQSPAALAALSSGAGALATVEQSLGQ